MLHFLSFIWICLLLAALAGALLTYAWLGRKRGAIKLDPNVKLQEDLEAVKGILQERNHQLEALKVELATATTERDRVRAEANPLNKRVNELTQNLMDSEKLRIAAEAKAKVTASGLKTLAELEAMRAERDQLKTALTQANNSLQDQAAELARKEGLKEIT